MSTANLDPLFEQLDAIAPEGYNFGFHIRYSRPSLVRMTYSAEWSQHYSAKKLILNDPSVVWGLMNTGSARWSEIELPDPLGVFTAAQSFGYRFGAAFGVGDVDTKSLGSCGRSDREFSDDEIDKIFAIFTAIHNGLEGKTDLKDHQKEALRLFGDGQTYDEICARLSISRTALRNRLSGARRILGVRSNTEAFRVAVEQGQIETNSYTGIVKGLPDRQVG